MEQYSLVGVDGNAFSVIGYVTKAMKAERFPKKAIEAYTEAAKSGDYDDLIWESLEQISKINRFCEFWESIHEELGFMSVEKKVAVDFYLRSGDDTDDFRDFVLANGLVEEIEL